MHPSWVCVVKGLRDPQEGNNSLTSGSTKHYASGTAAESKPNTGFPRYNFDRKTTTVVADLLLPTTEAL